MKEGQASITAQRVAAQRLTFERESAPYGDPDGDEVLARDVAADVSTARSDMVTYLAARTSFFDRVVVRALDGGMRQVVIAGAGYDGRALRYAKPAVRWFEVDHPDTQRDKRERLDRLGIDTAHITFVSVDFTTDDVATAVAATGHDASVPALILCEGVAVYLERAVLETLLRGLRAIAAPRQPSGDHVVGVDLRPRPGSTPGRVPGRVAAIGEPARTVLTADDADMLSSVTGWQPSNGGRDASAAGGLCRSRSRCDTGRATMTACD